MHVLTGIDAGLIRMRQPTGADVDALVAILAEPGVQAFGRPLDRTGVEALTGDDGARSLLLIEVDARPVGGIAIVDVDDPARPHAVIELFVSSRWQRKGIGTRALRAVVRRLLDDGCHRVVAEPEALNQGAIATYSRIGFRPVGVMRGARAGADGGWRDALLMELVDGELRA